MGTGRQEQEVRTPRSARPQMPPIYGASGPTMQTRSNFARRRRQQTRAPADVLVQAGVSLTATAVPTERASLVLRLAAYGMRYYAEHHLLSQLHSLSDAAARAAR